MVDVVKENNKLTLVREYSYIEYDDGSYVVDYADNSKKNKSEMHNTGVMPKNAGFVNICNRDFFSRFIENVEFPVIVVREHTIKIGRIFKKEHCVQSLYILENWDGVNRFFTEVYNKNDFYRYFERSMAISSDRLHEQSKINAEQDNNDTNEKVADPEKCGEKAWQKEKLCTAVGKSFFREEKEGQKEQSCKQTLGL